MFNYCVFIVSILVTPICMFYTRREFRTSQELSLIYTLRFYGYVLPVGPSSMSNNYPWSHWKKSRNSISVQCYLCESGCDPWLSWAAHSCLITMGNKFICLNFPCLYIIVHILYTFLLTDIKIYIYIYVHYYVCIYYYYNPALGAPNITFY